MCVRFAFSAFRVRPVHRTGLRNGQQEKELEKIGQRRKSKSDHPLVCCAAPWQMLFDWRSLCRCFFFLFGCVSLLSVVRPRLLLFRYFPPVLPPFVFNGFFLFTKRNTLRTRSKPVKHSSAATRSVKLSGNSVNTSHVTAVGHFPLDFFGLIFHL